MQVWLGQDGRVRGIVALGSITPEEFSEAFARWEPRLRRIGPEELTDEVYAAMRPGVIAEAACGGYRSVRFRVKQKARTSRALPVIQRENVPEFAPMPVIL